MMIPRERPRYISDHPVMALVAPALAAVVTALILIIAQAAKADTLYDARQAAAADKHREAIALYHQAIAERPEWRVRLARELGHQYTWADAPDTAIGYYRTYLNVYPDDLESRLGIARALAWAGHYDEAIERYRAIASEGGDAELGARLGIAQTLSWQDKLWPARREYEAILEDHPGNLDARIGRARVVNWAGRHREARGLFSGMLEEHPDNVDIREGLAASHHWMGRSDRALDTLDGHTGNRRLAELERDIHRARMPGASYTFSHSEDSDNVERDVHTVGVSFSPWWRTRAGVQYSRGDITQPQLPDVTRDHIQATLAHRFTEALAVTAGAGWESNGFDRAALGPEDFWQDEHDLFTLDLYATLTPVDWIRADVGVAHGSIDNPLPIFRGIELTEYSAGLDWRLAPTVLSVTSGSYTDYNDDNSRISVGERVDWSPAQRLPLPVNHRFTTSTGMAYYDFDRSPGNGYYSPDRYVSLYQGLAVNVRFGRRVSFDLSARIAAERENSGDWFSAGSLSASASWRIAGYLNMRAGYYNSRSRLDTRSGYESDGFYVGVDIQQ